MTATNLSQILPIYTKQTACPFFEVVQNYILDVAWPQWTMDAAISFNVHLVHINADTIDVMTRE